MVREALQSRGLLSMLRSRLRAEIYHSMEEQKNAPEQLPPVNIVVNELIREYLLFNRYQNTLSVFLSETGLDNAEPLARDILAEATNLVEEPHDSLLNPDQESYRREPRPAGDFRIAPETDPQVYAGMPLVIDQSVEERPVT
ncbi:hypothetical protein BESB_044830 [Besnoitia besnoiti]|uniref:Uncharacterized protein n=1 Tax=Besnoitia besnoiti TaxID=94643 RepID=A0A2A9MJ62_BESBE|nr:hypothetical protein BESB_044830 [Besnoitia besnoiti]PFH36291.1 hypothetical protein BESB_044830 [Besnoitia besnoiti]